MIVPIFLPHLGCEGRCIYCDQVYITHIGDSALTATIEKYLAPVRGPVEVGLYGGNIFGLDPAGLTRLFACFDPYRDRISGFRISTKPVPLDEETIRIISENGVKVIELGAPSFNNDILRTVNRRHTAEDVGRSFLRLREAGFSVALQVMAGLPGETMADIVETARNVAGLAPCYIRVYPLVVLKGTRLEAMYREGTYTPVAFEEAVTRVLYLYLHAIRAGIPVVKMGLTENEVIKERVVAGHYHPSFGYVVKTWAFRLAILAKVRESALAGKVTVRINTRDVPHLVGYKRSNTDRFKEEGVDVGWVEDDQEQGSFVIVSGSRTVEGNIFDALTMIPS